MKNNRSIGENKNRWRVSWQSVSSLSRSVCYDKSRRKCHCKSSRMFNHSLHHHLLLIFCSSSDDFYSFFSWFMTVNGRYLAFAKMAKWSDFAPLHFLTELGCEMLEKNGFVAYIKKTKKKKIHHFEWNIYTLKDIK